VTSEILRSGTYQFYRNLISRLDNRHTYWNAALEHLKSDIGPFTYRFKIHASVNERLCKISPSCFQSVRSNRNRTRDFVGLEKLDSLGIDKRQLLHFLAQGDAVYLGNWEQLK